MDTSQQTLFERIGGEEAISALLSDFYRRVLSDPALARYFHGVSMDKLQRMQSELFSAALGGPLQYSGRPVIHAHQHLHITLEDYQRFIKYLFETLRDYRLTDDESYEVVGRINLYTDEVLSSGVGQLG
ncbi:MAG: group 1 truncated hemoglobin [Nevskia sp.]|nr:group 1 truncated hemoglobin [Nevskia sp.]